MRLVVPVSELKPGDVLAGYGRVTETTDWGRELDGVPRIALTFTDDDVPSAAVAFRADLRVEVGRPETRRVVRVTVERDIAGLSVDLDTYPEWVAGLVNESQPQKPWRGVSAEVVEVEEP